jgi:hypothetical protein
MQLFTHLHPKFKFATLLLLVCSVFQYTQAQQSQDTPPPPSSSKAHPATTVSHITIEVTGGTADKPIENASVYLKTLEQHLIKDKKFEVNVKTNVKGVAHIPEAPTGRVLIQIVAEGWKSYGQWQDITDPNQTLKIHLDRPPKWY